MCLLTYSEQNIVDGKKTFEFNTSIAAIGSGVKCVLTRWKARRKKWNFIITLCSTLFQHALRAPEKAIYNTLLMIYNTIYYWLSISWFSAGEERERARPRRNVVGALRPRLRCRERLCAVERRPGESWLLIKIEILPVHDTHQPELKGSQNRLYKKSKFVTVGLS